MENGGGGGAGGFRTCVSFSVCGATPYPITVGAGGAGEPAPANTGGTSGTNSIFSTITSAGGGGGGASASQPACPCLVGPGKTRWIRRWRRFCTK
jgi:hypothetical protein